MTKVLALESLGTDNPNDHHYYVAYLIKHQDSLF